MPNYLVLTGGSHGIGRETIALYSKHGWHTINISRTPCNVVGVTNLAIDLMQPDWLQQHGSSLHKLVQAADKISLVHNAAAFAADNVATLDPVAFRKILEINLVAPVALNSLLIPLMKPGSSVIYIGSTLSEIAVPNRASYVTTKHALVGLMRATCQDLAGKQITTCCVCPGFVNTNMLTGAADKTTLDHFIKQKVTAQRLIEPQEIADLVYYCATHEVTNGAVLHANLGQVMS